MANEPQEPVEEQKGTSATDRKIAGKDSGTAEKAEAFYLANKKLINFGSIGILVVVVGLLYFFLMYMPERGKEADGKIYKAQEQFDYNKALWAQRDSILSVALNGGADYSGFLSVADEYGWTKAGNVSELYAGIIYLQSGDFQNAIDKLNEFDSDDLIFSSWKHGMIGDAQTELGNMDEGISSYKKAVETNPNDFTTPIFLYKAGMALESQGDFAGALEMFQTIKRKYPSSSQANGIDQYIAMVEARI